MASRVLQPLRPGRPLPPLLLPLLPPYGPLGRGPAGRPSPAQPRGRSSPLPAPAGGPAGPARPPGARAFSRAGPACRAKRPLDRYNAEFVRENRQVDGRKITLSWIPPGRPVRLLFHDGEAARAAQAGYKSRAVTVLGQPVATTQPKHGVKPFGWTIKLLGVPDAATADDIVAGLRPEGRPRRVDVGPKMPAADVDAMAASLKDKVAAFGPVLKWKYPPPTSRRVRIGVVFEHPASAEEAAKALDRQPLDFKNGTRALLAANADTAIQLRITPRQYAMTQAAIDEAAARWREKRVEFLTRPTGDDHIILTVVGNDHTYGTLREAAQEVEGILDGHLVVSKDGKPLWHPGLGPVLNKVKAVQDELPVHVVLSRKTGELKVFGALPVCRTAMKRIAAIIDEATPHEEPPSHDEDAPLR